jgi:hypothetical protein
MGAAIVDLVGGYLYNLAERPVPSRGTGLRFPARAPAPLPMPGVELLYLLVRHA